MMKKLLLAVAAALVLNLPAIAGTESTHDFKTLAPKILKSPKASPGLKNQKDDLAIVYGGEDIARKISNDSFSA
jgi:hypothetical protein